MNNEKEEEEEDMKELNNDCDKKKMTMLRFTKK